jgi:hypothetical protein
MQGSLSEIQAPTTWKPISRKHERSDACVIAQQYSSATFTFTSLLFQSRQEKFCWPFKRSTFYFFKRGVS